VKLRELAQAIADALPGSVEEVMLAGSVSRGVDEEHSRRRRSSSISALRSPTAAG
jgi:hypothetical protein